MSHGILVIVYVVSFLYILFCVEWKYWFFGVPICGYIVNVLYSPETCFLTAVEDFFRKKLNLPTIKGFLGHYKPIFIKILKFFRMK